MSSLVQTLLSIKNPDNDFIECSELIQGKTQSVMVEDVFKLAGYVSDGFKDGGYKRKKEEEDKKKWNETQK